MKKKIGIIGGTGLENITGLQFMNAVKQETPYGSPADAYRVYENDCCIFFTF